MIELRNGRQVIGGSARASRRSFLQRSVGAVAALIACAAYQPREALASEYCIKWRDYPACPEGTTDLCRVQYGPPSCTVSEVTVVSPNGKWYQSCKCYCPAPCGGCDPVYYQARGATRNSGICSCTCILL